MTLKKEKQKIRKNSVLAGILSILCFLVSILSLLVSVGLSSVNQVFYDENVRYAVGMAKELGEVAPQDVEEISKGIQLADQRYVFIGIAILFFILGTSFLMLFSKTKRREK